MYIKDADLSRIILESRVLMASLLNCLYSLNLSLHDLELIFRNKGGVLQVKCFLILPVWTEFAYKCIESRENKSIEILNW